MAMTPEGTAAPPASALREDNLGDSLGGGDDDRPQILKILTICRDFQKNPQFLNFKFESIFD
jgi:hypothetical protein